MSQGIERTQGSAHHVEFMYQVQGDMVAHIVAFKVNAAAIRHIRLLLGVKARIVQFE